MCPKGNNALIDLLKQESYLVKIFFNAGFSLSFLPSTCTLSRYKTSMNPEASIESDRDQCCQHERLFRSQFKAGMTIILWQSLVIKHGLLDLSTEIMEKEILIPRPTSGCLLSQAADSWSFPTRGCHDWSAQPWDTEVWRHTNTARPPQTKALDQQSRRWTGLGFEGLAFRSLAQSCEQSQSIAHASLPQLWSSVSEICTDCIQKIRLKKVQYSCQLQPEHVCQMQYN